jgi:coenzyme F420-0:L-glutamate ligase/coenzyme F420-1:gamma-L-glutamate ligase
VDFHAFLRSRRTVRAFQDTPIPEDVIRRMLEIAIQAPSAHNSQPWQFVVVQHPAALERLARLMGDEFRCDLLLRDLSSAEVDRRVDRSIRLITQAPLAILLCLDPDRLAPDSAQNPLPDRDKEYQLGVQSVALAGGTLLLAAHAEGLGSVWLCAPLYAPLSATLSLDLPVSWHPQALILLGYPLQIPPASPRRPLAEVMCYR